MSIFYIIVTLIVLILTAWVLITFFPALIANISLDIYLFKNQRKIWEKITSIGPLGPGLSNPFAYHKWLNSSDDDIHDSQLLNLKKAAKKHSKRFLLSFSILSACLTFFLLIFYAIF